MPTPWIFSYSALNFMPSALLGWLSGSCSATTTGPLVTKVPSVALPPTRMRSRVAAAWVW